MQIDSGYISPYMLTNPEKMLSELEQVPVLITDRKINNMKELLPVFEKLVASGKKDLFIIADDVSGDALTGIVMNNLK
jgi:chaperonin GroEL